MTEWERKALPCGRLLNNKCRRNDGVQKNHHFSSIIAIISSVMNPHWIMKICG